MEWVQAWVVDWNECRKMEWVMPGLPSGMNSKELIVPRLGYQVGMNTE